MTGWVSEWVSGALLSCPWPSETVHVFVGVVGCPSVMLSVSVRCGRRMDGTGAPRQRTQRRDEKTVQTSSNSGASKHRNWRSIESAVLCL